MTYICPVCGYDELSEPPEDWLICPCCNTMFGYSDENWGIDELRNEWIAVGAKWEGEDALKPECWSPINQLRNIGYEITDADRIAIASNLDDTTTTCIAFDNWPKVQWLVNILGDQQETEEPIIRKQPVEQFQYQRQVSTGDIHKLEWQPA